MKKLPISSRWVIQFLIIFGSTSLLIGVAMGTIYYLWINAGYTILATQETVNVQQQANIIAVDFQAVTSDLLYLARQQEMKQILALPDPVSRVALEQEYLAFAQTKPFYDQVRYLDKSGQEIARVNGRNGQPAIVSEGALQNKGDRYYFKDTFDLTKGEVFVSPLDLNIEQGQIEQPLKPMLRFGTPVFDDQGQKQGIVLLNYLGVILLDKLEVASTTGTGQMMLLNSDGFWLKGPTPADEWGFMYDDLGRTFGQRYPAAWLQLNQAESGQFETEQGLFTFITVYPLLGGQHSSTGSGQPFAPSMAPLGKQDYYWTIVSRVPPEVLQATPSRFFNQLLSLYLGVLVILALGTFSLVSIRASRRRAVATLRQLSSVVQQTADHVLITDQAGNITYVNPAFERDTGYQSWEIIGKNPRILKSDRQTPQFYQQLWETITAGLVFRGVMVNRTKTGELYSEEKTISPIRDKQGQITHFVSTGKDITIRQRAAEEREDLILELQQLLSEVKTLSGLLPICASCKKIRDDGGYWNQIEAYLSTHSQAEFTHGICPDCKAKIYAELDQEDGGLVD